MSDSSPLALGIIRNQQLIQSTATMDNNLHYDRSARPPSRAIHAEAAQTGRLATSIVALPAVGPSACAPAKTGLVRRLLNYRLDGLRIPSAPLPPAPIAVGAGPKEERISSNPMPSRAPTARRPAAIFARSASFSGLSAPTAKMSRNRRPRICPLPSCKAAPSLEVGRRHSSAPSVPANLAGVGNGSTSSACKLRGGCRSGRQECEGRRLEYGQCCDSR